MKRWILAGAVILGWMPALGATVPVALTSLRAVHELSGTEAAKGRPVAFEGTVSYYNKSDIDLFIQDGDLGIYVQTIMGAGIALGDRVLVRGHTRDSFRTDILGDSVTVLNHGTPPKPLTANFDQMISSQLDCRRVTARAVVRSADMVVD